MSKEQQMNEHLRAAIESVDELRKLTNEPQEIIDLGCIRSKLTKFKRDFTNAHGMQSLQAFNTALKKSGL
jgi:hypothetical protein